MFWGIAVLVMFVLYITANGELPIYISFFYPQTNTSDTGVITQEQANQINSQTIQGPFGPLPNPFPVLPNTGANPGTPPLTGP